MFHKFHKFIFVTSAVTIQFEENLKSDHVIVDSQGRDQEQAQKQYMEILRSWPGYGSTLFDVEVM